METAINSLVLPASRSVTQKYQNTLWNKLLAVADGQANNETGWFLFSLVFQGVCFLPIPAVLIYYYHASIIVLPVTFALFLGSLIVGMGGSGIRVMLGFFICCAIVNLSMLAFYLL